MHPSGRNRHRSRRWRPQYLLALVMVPLAAFLTASPSSLDTVAKFIPAAWFGSLNVSKPSSLLAGGCNIKGNISINTGERIYHVLGQEHYWETRISPQYGERWFCTEEEARAAGWRKARR
ncbi:sunset domain-containing protein [Mesorhizobium sp. 43Arga]